MAAKQRQRSSVEMGYELLERVHGSASADEQANALFRWLEELVAPDAFVCGILAPLSDSFVTGHTHRES